MTDCEKEYVAWLWRAGTSSACMLMTYMGIEPSDPSPPWDRGDFGRCLEMLAAFPEVRAVLPVLAEKYPQWKPVAMIWSELTLLYKDRAQQFDKLIKAAHGLGHLLQDEHRRWNGWMVEHDYETGACSARAPEPQP